MRAVVMLALAGVTASVPSPPAWREPAAPFHVIGPIYDVGTKGLAAYLIRTGDGAILLDGTLAENVPGIERNIAALGVPLSSVKILLNSHAHFDHAAGLAQLKHDTGARLAAMDADAPALESGVPPSVTNYGVVTFPKVKVDRVLHDGDRVTLGGVTMTALETPGHTPGCTSWTMPVREAARTLRVIFACSLTVGGNRLIDNRGYPGIVADFRASFARLAGVKADVVLTAHPEPSQMAERRARAAAAGPGAWVDPAQLGRMVAVARTAFDKELAEQQRTK